MINGIYLKLGSLLDNYDVKPLSKFGGNRKNRTNSTSHSLRYPGGYRFVRTVTKGLKVILFFPVIDKPRRVYKNSALPDNIFVNKLECNLLSGFLVSDISDGCY